ncbi:hypothetical protein [Sinomicrobium soli]|uniref:hypothetical protein n=1 Tax=Sinomicrobium sp. N-1-3-6 TaxID=2219864 RepID=UPI000DCE930B|nr:hypothetical protein [Sinomicrobium sp. N-1-3-6]RAV28749.1 hypothetical protein DN748_12440 [Sinomicrobium sp. N-1-3-6]
MSKLQKIFCIFILAVITVSCYEAERNCKDFKTGTFEFTYILNGEEVHSTFVRNDSINIDYIGEEVDTASVTWVSDCEFIMRKLHPHSLQEKKAVQVRILSTGKDSYTFEYSVVGDSKNKHRGTATRID